MINSGDPANVTHRHPLYFGYDPLKCECGISAYFIPGNHRNFYKAKKALDIFLSYTVSLFCMTYLNPLEM